MQTRFVFVVLHYLTLDDTILCVNSIKDKCVHDNYHIVVVDNGSPNGTGASLNNTYYNDDYVTVILSKDNVGFSKGNNIGFRFAKEKLKPDFIILCNNDTLLTQYNTCDLILKEYNFSKFSVLGPKIILKDGLSNPVNLNRLNYRQIENQLRKDEISLIFDKVYILYISKVLFRQVVTKMKSTKMNIKTTTANERHKNIVLHGCFLVFSKMYIDRFEGLNENVFLYREEELLYLRLINSGLDSIYNPNIVIRHNEDSATTKMNRSRRKREIFKKSNRIKSTKVLLLEMAKCKDI